MFDDSTSGVSFNKPSSTPIQGRDDRTVNQMGGNDNRDKGKFQKLLNKDERKVDSSADGEEEIADSASALDVLRKNQEGSKSGLDFSLGDEGGGDKDELLSLLKGIEADREKQTQGLGVAEPSITAVPQDAKFSPMSVSSVSGQGTTGASAADRAEVWQLVEKVVETITAMKGDGKVETTVTLKGPPLFQGAQVRIEEFDHARGEFNIAFENLSPQAKMLVDLDSNRDNLRRSLEERGYMLHIMTSNTEIEKPKTAQSSPFFQDRNGQQQSNQGGQGQQNPQDEEEEA